MVVYISCQLRLNNDNSYLKNTDLTYNSNHSILRKHCFGNETTGLILPLGRISAPRGFFIPDCTFPTDGCCIRSIQPTAVMIFYDRTTMCHPGGHCTREADTPPNGWVSFVGEFDPGSGLTLAACLMHASRTVCLRAGSGERLRNTYEPTPVWGTTRRKPR